MFQLSTLQIPTWSGYDRYTIKPFQNAHVSNPWFLMVSWWTSKPLVLPDAHRILGLLIHPHILLQWLYLLSIFLPGQKALSFSCISLSQPLYVPQRNRSFLRKWTTKSSTGRPNMDQHRGRSLIQHTSIQSNLEPQKFPTSQLNYAHAWNHRDHNFHRDFPSMDSIGFPGAKSIWTRHLQTLRGRIPQPQSLGSGSSFALELPECTSSSWKMQRKGDICFVAPQICIYDMCIYGAVYIYM